MASYTQGIKVQSVARPHKSQPLTTCYSTLQRWIHFDKKNKLENPESVCRKKKAPKTGLKRNALKPSWIVTALSAYCRENGIYPHHAKRAFLSENQTTVSRMTKKLKQENKRLQKELNRRTKHSLKLQRYTGAIKKVPSDLGGKGGRLIAFPIAKQYCALIDEAVQNGARQQLACELVGIASRTYQRWNQGEAFSRRPTNL